MTSFIYDFKDIASRMKGDLLPRKEPKVELIDVEPNPYWRIIHLPCSKYHGGGQDHIGRICSWCCGSGMEP